MRASWVVVAVLLGSAGAYADPTADELFTRGRERLKAGDNEGACAAFEASLRLEHAFGTLFNLGDCEVKLGKLASALRVYREVADGDPNAERRAKAAQLATDLAARVPHLAISIATPTSGVVATVDGEPFDPASELPLDVGAHELIVRAPGFVEIRQALTVQEHDTVRVPITLVRASAGPPPPPPPPPPPRPARSTRARTGKIVAIAGAVATVGGLVVGTVTFFQWRDVQDQNLRQAQACRAMPCSPAVQTEIDDRTASVQHLGDVSTLLVGIGLATVATGAVLWVTAPNDHAVRVVPTVSPGVAGLVVAGRF